MSHEVDMLVTLLEEICQPLGVDPAALYVNQVADVIDHQVIMSRNLVDEALHHLDLGQEPTYDQGLFGVFHAPDTFEAQQREPRVRLPDLERVISRVLRQRPR